MLYTQELTIPESGEIRIGTIGGSPDELEKDGNRSQVGYQLPPRAGAVKWYGTTNSTDIYAVEVEVEGYGGRVLGGMVGPGMVNIELPCSISFKGEPGLKVIVEAWKLEFTTPFRGSKATYRGEVVSQPVPQWADTFDFSGGPSASTPSVTFRDAAGAVVGIWHGNAMGASVVGMSVPNGSVTVTTVGPQGFLSLRQG